MAAMASALDLPRRRVYACSDIHTDNPENMEHIEALQPLDDESDDEFGPGPDSHRHDTLIVAGDIAASGALLLETLEKLQKAYGHVMFTPGNHDLWLQGRHEKASAEYCDSVEKCRWLLAECKKRGVGVNPRRIVGGQRTVTIAPLVAWHHQSWDTEPDIEGWAGIPKVHEVMSDYHLCKWPKPLDPCTDSVAAALDRFNDGTDPLDAAAWFDGTTAEEACGRAREAGDDVITFSHFLPILEINPEKRFLYFPNLSKAVGSNFLRRRVVDSIKPDLHIFGHTHFGWDATYAGIRYIQPPLCYPHERKERMCTVQVGESPTTPLCVWDSTVGFSPPFLDSAWPSYYRHNARNPQNVTELPNYVATRYENTGRGRVGWGKSDPPYMYANRDLAAAGQAAIKHKGGTNIAIPDANKLRQQAAKPRTLNDLRKR